ncbi:hypothetical protein [Clostridium autoethanogenum]|uniref:hypothetical protein n=1 Tax=Clostridium autoethanogenum TaxID=84023 RepID=UPI001604B4A2|nr:hypothetical protein [Clostridium autoethanogenum]
MTQIYKKENFIVIPVCNEYLVINTDKVFKKGHAHARDIKVARLLIDLSLEKRLPKNPYFADNLIRISLDEKYIKRLQAFKSDEYIGKNDYRELMKAHSYRRHKGALHQVT